MNKGEEMMEQKLNECYEVRIWAERNEEEYQAPAGEYWDYDSLTVYKDTQGKWHRTPDIDKEFSKEADFFYVRNSPTKIVEDIYRIFEEAGMERFKVFNYTVDAEGHFQASYHRYVVKVEITKSNLESQITESKLPEERKIV